MPRSSSLEILCCRSGKIALCVPGFLRLILRGWSITPLGRMNQRGGSLRTLERSARSTFRKIFGVLALVSILTFSRSAHAQGYVIFNPPSSNYLGGLQSTNLLLY